MDITRKVIAITGAGRGLGRAIALSLAEQGAVLALIDVNRTDLEVTEAEVRSRDGRCALFVCNVASEPEVEATFAAIKDQFGALHGLVNCAGINFPGSITTATPAQVDAEIAVNLQSALHLVRLIMPGMLARDRGHIINISSIAGIYNFIGSNTLYHTTKAAMHMLSRQLRVDALGKRVRVTEICPGRVATDIFAHVNGTDAATARAQFIDGFELPEAADIADAIAFAIAAPIAVNISNMEILPTLQVAAGLTTVKPDSY